MKKIYNYSLFVIIGLIINTVQAQEEHITDNQPDAVISITSRYIDDDNSVELRFYPDRKSLLYAGIKDGYMVERMELDENTEEKGYIYKKIGESYAFTETQWNELIAKNKGKKKEEIKLAKHFFDNINNNNVKKSNKTIEDIYKQKNDDDFEYLVFILSAVKNKQIAEALGLGYLDKTINKKKKYVYRVSLINKPKNYEIESFGTLVETIEKDYNYTKKIQVIQADSKLAFVWDESEMLSGIEVERKNNKTNNWEIVTTAPIYNIAKKNKISFEDNNLINYQTYEYKFYGNNSFGERILFGSAKGMPLDLTPPKKPIITMAKQINPNEIEIKWKLSQPVDNDLKGFMVARSESTKGRYKILHKNLLPKNTRSYKDYNFKKQKNNYYVLQAVDTSGNISSTIPFYVMLIDSIPPTKPIIDQISVDSIGVVKIHIKRNPEEDLMGYRIFRSNSEKHEFSAIDESFISVDSLKSLKNVKTTFNDTITLKSLTPKVYYRIKALDYNYNQSDFSDIYKINRPDTIPPTTPVFNKVRLNKDNVILGFSLSHSKDVDKHFLYRKKDDEKKWEKIYDLKKGEKKYIDKNIENNHTYYYSLRAMDTSSLYSDYAVPVHVMTKEIGKINGINDFNISTNKKKVILNWSYPNKNENFYFVIYKKTNNNKLKQYKRVKASRFEEIVASGTYEYAVRVYNTKGNKSTISSLQKINIP